MPEQKPAQGHSVRRQPDQRPLTDLMIALAASLGGFVWSWTVIITALRPAGVPGAHRSTLDLHPTILVAFILMGAATNAIAAWKIRSRPARTAAMFVWFGTLIFAVNVTFILTTGDDAPVWPTHYLGIFVVALGSSILGPAMARASTASLVIPILLIAAVLVLPFSQMQDARVSTVQRGKVLPDGVGQGTYGAID